MKLLFKQRMFSWTDTYDIYDETGKVMFFAKGQIAWGHLLRIYDANGVEVGYIREELFTFMPKFEIYHGESYAGCVQKEFAPLKPTYNIDYNGWGIDGDMLGWNYWIHTADRKGVATVTRQHLQLTDTYVIDILNPQDALDVLALVLAIDAEKCTRRARRERRR